MGQLPTIAWASLAAYFALMLGIGLYAFRRAQATAEGYMLGGRDLGPAVTALSAGASDMSGWLLMGLPGAILIGGLSQAWIGIGLVIGAWANYHLVAPRLRTLTERMGDAITIPDFLAERFGDRGHALRILSAAVIILFFTLYCSAGMVAAGKFAQSALGMDYLTGLLIATGAVVIYVLFGGFLAVSLTDFVQGCIMFAGLILVPLVALAAIGGLDALTAALAAREAATDLELGQLLRWSAPPLAIISAAAWGLGYFGQPHIIVRFMAIRDVRDLPLARRINIVWMSISLAGAVLTGLIGAAWLAKTGTAIDDPETIFIQLARILFHPLVTGFLLAAILAAIMSTISSQLLVSASSLAEDIWRGAIRPDASERSVVAVGRIAVIAVTLVAGWLALDPESSILALVANAWAGFGAAFGPVILFALWDRRASWAGALAGMATGAITVILWSQLAFPRGSALYTAVFGYSGPDVFRLSDLLYELVPGFLATSLIMWLVSRLTPPPSPERLAGFDAGVAATRLDSAPAAH